MALSLVGLGLGLTSFKGVGVPFGALLLNGQTITLNNDPITLVEED